MRLEHRRHISKADLAAAARLKAIWKAMPHRPTQQALADAWGDHANQALISQYMNGRIALNYRAVLFFSNALGVEQSAIRSDLPEQAAGAQTTKLRAGTQSQAMRLDPATMLRALRYLDRRFMESGHRFDPHVDTDLLCWAYELEATEGAPVSNIIDFGQALAERTSRGVSGSGKGKAGANN